MKYFRCLSLGVALMLCVCLCAPSNVSAASSPRKSNSQKVLAQKKSSKKSKESRAEEKSKKRDDKKSGKSKRKDGKDDKKLSQTKESRAEHKGKKRDDKKSGKSKRKDGGSDERLSQTGDSERDIWIRRAQESEIYTGKASWFGKDFHNKPTASGLPYDMYTFTAAHRTLPLGTVVKVTDQKNGKSVMVCVTDRGPYIQGRIIDLSYAAAKRLDLSNRGVGKVNLEVVSDQNGMPIKPGLAYFVKYAAGNGKKKVGPFDGFADAAAMQEALIQAHPEAEVVLENASR